MKRYNEKIINMILDLNLFDYDYYLENNVDVKNSNVDALSHYLNFGYKEGRNPSKKFNNDFYINKYLSVENENICPLIHYILYGDEDTVINPLSMISNGQKTNKKFLTKDHVNKMLEEDFYFENRGVIMMKL